MKEVIARTNTYKYFKKMMKLIFHHSALLQDDNHFVIIDLSYTF